MRLQAVTVANRLSRRLPRPGDCLKYNTHYMQWYRDNGTTIGGSLCYCEFTSAQSVVVGRE